MSSKWTAEVVRKESRHEAEFALLGDTVANLELVPDPATTAAALSRINENIHSAEKRKADAVRDRGQLMPWADYFNDLHSLLSAPATWRQPSRRGISGIVHSAHSRRCTDGRRGG